MVSDEHHYEGGVTMEEEIPVEESRFPKWALIAGVVVVCLCLAVLVALFLARTELLSVAVNVLASATPSPSATLPATNTLPPPPTETATIETTPTDTPSPTALPMPPMEIMSLTQGSAALDEQFVDNSNNWVGISPTSEVTIQEGQLQLRSTESKSAGIVYCQGDCGPYQDFYYYQSDIVEDRPSTIGLGMVFGMNQAKSAFYSFRIRPSSADYSLAKVSNGEWTPLIDWTPSPAVKFYPFINTVGVSYREGTIDLYINGQKLDSYTDEQPYKSGRIGFSVDTDGVRLLASNVSVYTLNPVTPQPAITQASPLQSPIYQSPTPGYKYTPTATQVGGCPASVPTGMFVLTVFRASPKPGKIEIDGQATKTTQGVNVYYLTLKKTHIVKINSKSYELYYDTCKIVGLRMN
jgi:hypothetical protein